MYIYINIYIFIFLYLYIYCILWQKLFSYRKGILLNFYKVAV